MLNSVIHRKSNLRINASLSFTEGVTRTIVQIQILFHCSEKVLDYHSMKIEIDQRRSCLVNKGETNQNRILKKYINSE